MDEDTFGELREAIYTVLRSKTERKGSGEAANIVDVLAELARSNWGIAEAICPRGAAPGQDAWGGSIESLTEAAMSIGSGLKAVADAISDVAHALNAK